MKAIHLPFDKANPYQRMLLDGLTHAGVECIGASWTWRLGELVDRESPDVLHFHWTHYWSESTPIWKFPAAILKFRRDLAAFKGRGGRVVWTVHNLQGHEKINPRRDRIFSTTVASSADAVIAHTDSAASLVKQAFSIPASRMHVVPHGNYIDEYPNDLDQAAARARLNISADAPVTLFFGAVRRYKGVIELIEAFRAVADSEALLIIAGRTQEPEYEQEVREAAMADPRVRLILEFVDDADVQVYLNAADALVFPYRDMLTSGAIVLAMSFGKASIIPNFPMMKEVAGDSAVAYDRSANGLASAIARVGCTREGLADKGRVAFDRVQDWDWNRVGSMVAESYGTAR